MNHYSTAVNHFEKYILFLVLLRLIIYFCGVQIKKELMMKKICVSISQSDYDYLKSKGRKTFGREHGAVSKSIALLIKEDRQDLDLREVGDKFTVKAEGVYQGNNHVWVPEQDLML